MNNPITDEEIAELEALQKEGSGVGIIAISRALPKLLFSLKALKAENEKLSVKNDELLKFDLDRGLERNRLIKELHRARNVCVALESHIADSSLARFRHENVDRFIPEPGYPNGTDSEIEVASPFEIHPEGVPTR